MCSARGKASFSWQAPQLQLSSTVLSPKEESSRKLSNPAILTDLSWMELKEANIRDLLSCCWEA